MVRVTINLAKTLVSRVQYAIYAKPTRLDRFHLLRLEEAMSSSFLNSMLSSFGLFESSVSKRYGCLSVGEIAGRPQYYTTLIGYLKGAYCTLYDLTHVKIALLRAKHLS